MSRLFRSSLLILTVAATLLFPCALRTPGSMAYVAKEAQTSPGPYEIALKSRQFVPQPGIESALVKQLAAASAARVHVLIQFDHIPGDRERQALAAAGIELLTYVPHNAWYASIPTDLDTARQGNGFRASALAPARWIGRVEPADRLSPYIRAGNWGPWSQYPGDTVSLVVQGHTDVPLDEVAALVKDRDGEVIRQVTSIHAVVALLPRSEIEALSGEDAIHWIEETAPPLAPANDGSRPLIHVDALQTTPYNLDGTGVNVLVYDAGLVDTAHDDLTGRVTQGETGTLSDHSTHVAGTIGGDGTLSVPPTTTVDLSGMAPSANIISFQWDSTHLVTDPGDIQANYNTAIATHSAHIANNSIGSNVARNYPSNCAWEGDYNTMAGQIDGIVRGSQASTKLPVVWANGNERGPTACGQQYNTTPPPVTAKNVIAVGAVNTNDRSMTTFSSWGPTDDGRLRPDVVAGGCQNGGDGGIRSTVPDSFINKYTLNCDGAGDDYCFPYDTMCGTSMAAPAVTGASALLLQRYRAICSKSGGDPLPSTVKALLIHTAVDLGNAGPDYRFGYGLVDARAAVDAIPYHREDSIIHGATNALAVTVGAAQSMTVTLVWDDPPASASAAAALVNNLDLELVDPSLTVHRPFVLNPTTPANVATTGLNTRDNVEQVVVNAPASGLWLIRVRGTSVPTGPQSYTLVSEVLDPSLASCAPPEPTDVWIRDNTTDNGIEPSSGTLYLSPDIWVRRAADGGTGHQNPEYGQTNHIYARVRNRGTVQAATVSAYVYWGNASTGLSWPSTMHLAGIATVTNLSAGGVATISPIPWSPPGTGHYCLYLRLISPQDPIPPPPEVSSISANTKAHNNIAWKNLNIVDNLPNTASSASFIIRNVTRDSKYVHLLFRPEFAYLVRSTILLDLGPDLYELCREGGCEYIGLEDLGDGKFLFGQSDRTGIEYIPLGYMQEAEVKLQFTAPPGDAPRTWTMDVTQEGAGGVEGGIQYQLRTPGTPVISEVYYQTVGPADDNQFVELYNPHDETVYLDGLVLVHDEDVYQFPGRLGGRQYPLHAGSHTVIANDAVDDRRDVELAGATWEVWGQGDDSDNPDVPNVTLVVGQSPDLNLEVYERDGIMIASGTDLRPPIAADTVIDGVNWDVNQELAEVLADTNLPDARPHRGARQDGLSLQRQRPTVDLNDSSRDLTAALPTLAADVGISLAAPPLAAPGSEFVYTLHYTSYETLAATGVEITLDLPRDVTYLDYEAEPLIRLVESPDPLVWEIDALKPRERGEINVRVEIGDRVPVGRLLAATAKIDMNPRQIEGDPTNNEDETETRVAVAEVGVFKYVARDRFEEGQFSAPFPTGDTMTYTINYGNAGELPSPNVIITDHLPDGVRYVGYESTAPVSLKSTEPLVWAVGTLPPGASETIRLIAEVNHGLADGTVLLNEAMIEGEWDREPGNNHSGAWVTISVERRPIYLPLIARSP